VEENPVKKSKEQKTTPEQNRLFAHFEAIEKSIGYCPRCGTKLEGRIKPFLPEHKYCDSCMIYVLNWFVGMSDLPDEFLV
jgi:hypothetical protein